MLQTPPEVAARFDAAMLATGVAEHHRPHFCRWLRFYLDFCDKYRSEPADAASLRAFEEKLRSKGQAPWQRQQAHQAVVLYWSLRTEGTTQKGAKATPAVAASVTRSALASAPAGEAVDVPGHSCRRSRAAASAPHEQAAGRAASAQQLVSRMEATSEREHPAPVSRNEAAMRDDQPRLAVAVTGGEAVAHARASGALGTEGSAGSSAAGTTPVPAADQQALQPTDPMGTPHPPAPAAWNWQKVYSGLEEAIKVRHYSAKTLKSYRAWTRKLHAYVQNRAPDTLSTEDVKAFLTFLAVEKQVSASSQNQAFNALLFLFRHVLGKDFGQVEGVVRAKRKPYIPVVLSRQEVDRLIGALGYPYDLVARLLYGCGLRLFECLKLRVQDVNLDMMVLTVHDGKGKKDRTVPLPRVLRTELELQFEQVACVHREDLAAGYAGTLLPSALDLKYKNAAREFVWQWFFPAKTLTEVPDTGEHRRFHLHESHVQKAIKQAVGRVALRKRASAHTLRHSYASHFLQANYDIRTIQELFGHSDVRTTMIYTHTIPSVTVKEAKSPLDLR